MSGRRARRDTAEMAMKAIRMLTKTPKAARPSTTLTARSSFLVMPEMNASPKRSTPPVVLEADPLRGHVLLQPPGTQGFITFTDGGGTEGIRPAPWGPTFINGDGTEGIRPSPRGPTFIYGDGTEGIRPSPRSPAPPPPRGDGVNECDGAAAPGEDPARRSDAVRRTYGWKELKNQGSQDGATATAAGCAAAVAAAVPGAAASCCCCSGPAPGPAAGLAAGPAAGGVARAACCCCCCCSALPLALLLAWPLALLLAPRCALLAAAALALLLAWLLALLLALLRALLPVPPLGLALLLPLALLLARVPGSLGWWLCCLLCCLCCRWLCQE